MKFGNILRRLTLAVALAGFTAPIAVTVAQAQSSEVRYVVNNIPVTSYDIQRRAAFLRLQNRGGNLQKVAADEMIDQAIRAAEMRRLRINVSDEQVASAYERFARSNNMSSSQMDNVLSQAGVTRAHFVEFIRSQMGWGQVVGARESGGRVSEQDAVQRMLQQGGNKPTATEYMLQQVIFVIPARERNAKMGVRTREAEALRQRFRGCDSTREFAKGLIDVTVRDLGRVLETELPPDWEKQIKSTRAGSATAPKQTERGVEFIGICSSREVSDDRVAQMVFQAEQGGGANDDGASDKIMKELRSKAQIIRR